MIYDAIIVGGGPAGASCAAFCAQAGLQVLVLERAAFPRDKVCGDCLNPECWPVLERLGVAEQVRRLPHTLLRQVEFISLRGRRVVLPLPDGPRGEIAVKRRLLDALLLEHAVRSGAEVRQLAAVTALHRRAADAKGARFAAEVQDGDPAEGSFLVAADGRNSLVARLTGLAADRSRAAPAPAALTRIGLQTHVPCPATFGATVQMRWFGHGYGGLAPVGGGELNISLAGPARALTGLKQWATAEFAIAPGTAWRTIAPLDRWTAPLAASVDGVFLLGDAARVVEPFTGEGIYYALRSGELAAGSHHPRCPPGPDGRRGGPRLPERPRRDVPRPALGQPPGAGRGAASAPGFARGRGRPLAAGHPAPSDAQSRGRLIVHEKVARGRVPQHNEPPASPIPADPAMLAAALPFSAFLALAANTAAPANPSLLSSPMVPVLFMGIIFYFLLIRPQQKRAKEQAAMIASIKSGDRIVTSGGLHGIVANARDADDKTILVKFAENVKLEVDRSAITTVSKVSGGEAEAKAALPAAKAVS